MLRLHPTTLTLTTAELRDFDRRCRHINWLKERSRQDAHPHTANASPAEPEEDESTDANEITTPGSSTASQVADDEAALMAPVQSDSAVSHTPPGTTTEEEEAEEEGASFSDVEDHERALDSTPRADSSSRVTPHLATDYSGPRPLGLPPPFSQTPRSITISPIMTTNQTRDHLQGTPPSPSGDFNGAPESVGG